ncbi:hypothetical protein [Streptomyces clavifer]|uniref:hypothetical protein n=1 Tax=Streptomyces clavifer TaxID=68188 RepID=UPI00308EE198|nr:hypothetical protein OG388_26600 [Streptomyces clavifer]
MAHTTDPRSLTVRPLPGIDLLTDPQQRGWCCVWCGASLGVGLGTSLGEERVVPPDGAAYSWFPRECPDTQACAAREARR